MPLKIMATCYFSWRVTVSVFALKDTPLPSVVGFTIFPRTIL
jgi:hypothetical protein